MVVTIYLFGEVVNYKPCLLEPDFDLEITQVVLSSIG
jgi:hypothetical protein